MIKLVIPTTSIPWLVGWLQVGVQQNGFESIHVIFSCNSTTHVVGVNFYPSVNLSVWDNTSPHDLHFEC